MKPTGPRPPYRFVATLAILGVALLTTGTLVHPAHADPGLPSDAFAEYAAVGRGLWVSDAGRGRAQTGACTDSKSCP